MKGTGKKCKIAGQKKKPGKNTEESEIEKMTDRKK
jgi:hypothetical protein